MIFHLVMSSFLFLSYFVGGGDLQMIKVFYKFKKNHFIYSTYII